MASPGSQDAGIRAAFVRGVATGVGVSAVTMFVGLGVWFGSAEGAPYRAMLGEPTRLALDTKSGGAQGPTTPARVPASSGVQGGTRADVGARPAQPTTQPPRWPVALGALEVAYDKLLEGTTADGTSQQGVVHGASAGSVVAAPDDDALPTGFAFDLNADDGQARWASGQAAARVAGKAATGSQPEDPGAYRELGVDELVKQHEHNREVVGRAAALLRGLSGKSP